MSSLHQTADSFSTAVAEAAEVEVEAAATVAIWGEEEGVATRGGAGDMVGLRVHLRLESTSSA